MRAFTVFAALLLAGGTISFSAVAAVAEKTCALPATKARVLTLPASLGATRAAVTPSGMNTLYSLDDDAFWQSATTHASLREAGVRSLRFPGGETSDNYDWRAHRLVNPKGWPGDGIDDKDRASRTDYTEFLAHARAVGATELFFVANLDTAFRKPGSREANLLAQARSAAEWVAAVKKAGFPGQYWEIGNEPNISPGFPLTAEEYAAALNVYAREMRAADPQIKIGAAGPTKIKTVGFADRLSADQRAYLREHGGGTRIYCGKSVSADECAQRLASKRPGKADNAVWWPTLLRLAGNSFDFAVVHRYELVDTASGKEKALLKSATQLNTFSRDLAALMGRPVPVTLTEWNMPPENMNKDFSASEQLLDVAVQYGNLVASGIAQAHFYPLQASSEDERSFLEHSGAPRIPAKVFALFTSVRAGDAVVQAVPARGVYVLQYRRSSGLGHMIVNTTSKALRVRLPTAADEPVLVDGLAATANDVASLASCAAPRESGAAVVPVPAHTVIRIRQFRTK